MRERRSVARAGRAIAIALLVALVLVAIAALALAMLPLAPLKGYVERKAAASLGAPVSIRSLDRRERFSLSPTVVVRDVRVRQPAWAGTGDLIRAREISARVPILSILLGRGIHPEGLTARGLDVALVRDAAGRGNWEGTKPRSGKDGSGRGLTDLVVLDSRLSIRDAKRHLAIAGPFAADRTGVRFNGIGRFHDAKTVMKLRGDSVAGRGADAPYALTLDFASPFLTLVARTRMEGAFNTRSMSADLTARGRSLKYLDDLIEAGLFGTQPIALSASIRHEGRDWFIRALKGRIGRSTLAAGRADVLKRDGRTKVDADMHFAGFSFDDLSDDKGRAAAAAVEARIGQRVLPGTRINLAKIGPTDGIVRFRTDRLLIPGSLFRSLRADIRLDGKLVRVEHIAAGMASGRLTGSIGIDHRQGAPKLSLDLRIAGARLSGLMGTNAVDGPLRAHVALTGRGDTVRAALANADGKVGLIVADGTVRRTVAAVLGQDLGKAIGAALGNPRAMVPLRCLGIGFRARGGVLTASPFVADTAISQGQGTGRILLSTERLALTIRGSTRDPSALRLVDPIRVAGTMWSPILTVDDLPASGKVDRGRILKTVGRSITAALGLGPDRPPAAPPPSAVNCGKLAARIL